jgi:hypothetical protein
MKKLAHISGWIGLAFAQLSGMIALFPLVMGWTSAAPPLNMVISLTIGLGMLTFQSFIHWNKLYFTANVLGFITEIGLIVFILSH